MSLNLSRTLFYEFYKSDPNFIYESVEEYRNYKSDPNFAEKTLEEYRRFKAAQKNDVALIHQSASKEAPSSSESEKNKNVTTTIENKIETENENKTELENRNWIEEDIDDKIEKEVTELKIESMAQEVFERSVEQFWDNDAIVLSSSSSESPSRCHSETLSTFDSEASLRFNPENEVSAKATKKKVKSKFRIPKSRSTMNYSSVSSRYMDVFVKKFD